MNPSFRFSALLIATALAFSAHPLESQAAPFPALSSARPLISIRADANPDGAQRFIDSVSTRGIGFLSGGKLTLEEQKKSFRLLLRDSFDLNTIGRFALGKYWRAANTAERAEYQRLFENMVVDVYAARFASYKGQQLKTTGADVVENGDVLVHSDIVPADGSEKVKVDWRVRKTAGTYRVVDVVVEGVSMAITQRSDFAAVIGQGDGDVSVLIAHLKNGIKK